MEIQKNLLDKIDCAALAELLFPYVKIFFHCSSFLKGKDT